MADRAERKRQVAGYVIRGTITKHGEDEYTAAAEAVAVQGDPVPLFKKTDLCVPGTYATAHAACYEAIALLSRDIEAKGGEVVQVIVEQRAA